MLDALSTDWQSMVCQPAFHQQNTAYIREYDIVAKSKNLIIRIGTNTGIKCEFGNGDEKCTTYRSFSDYEVCVDDYYNENEDEAVVEFTLSYEEAGKKSSASTYRLHFISADYAPVITKEPEDYVCEKDEPVVLSVEIEEPEEGTVSYQWQKRGDRKSTRLNSSHNVISRMPSSA